VISLPTSLASLSPAPAHIDPAAAICRANSTLARRGTYECPRPDCCLSSKAFSCSSPVCPLTRHLLRDRVLLHRFRPHSVPTNLSCALLHHHQVGVISGVCHRSHPLKGGEEMHWQFTDVLIVAGRPELLSKPADGLMKASRTSSPEHRPPWATRRQAANWTSSTRKLLPVRVDSTHESEQPSFENSSGCPLRRSARNSSRRRSTRLRRVPPWF